ncbi:MAG: hypothetical protein JXL80_14685, partial [Planctomycetes bacterium]|nr:hypothetical protein [Planctomycetota bacterium]
PVSSPFYRATMQGATKESQRSYGKCGLNDIETLGAMAVRRWAGWQAEHCTLDYVTHPCGSKAYMLTYEAPWSFGQMIITKTIGMLHEGKEYRINARCPIEAAEEWMPVLNRILDSFRFTSKQRSDKAAGED